MGAQATRLSDMKIKAAKPKDNRADYIERRRPMMAWWSEHIQKAATGDFSIAAIHENRSRKVVSIR